MPADCFAPASRCTRSSGTRAPIGPGRSPGSGSKLIPGDLLDRASLVRAFADVAAVYAVTTPFAVIAPSCFFENVLGSRIAIIGGRLPLPLPSDRPLHQVALADLGQLVTAVLARRDEHVNRRIEVAGDAPTPNAMAAALGVRFEPVPLEAIRQRSADIAAMYAFLADEGYAIDVPRLRAAYPEVAWTSFADWAREIDWSPQR